MPNTVYDELRDAIVAGSLPPGSQLAEAALAKQYGLSRTPIREALLKLRQDGLVEPNGRGLEVRRQSPEEILEIYGVRVLLEEFAARTAATNRSELDLNRLIRLHEEMTAISSDDSSLLVRWNNDFHEQLWNSSHNQTLIEMLHRITTQLHRYPETTLTFPGRWDEVIAEHAEIIEAVKERRPEDAARIASHHFNEARDIRLKMFAMVTL